MNIDIRAKELTAGAYDREDGRLALESHLALPEKWRGACGPLLLVDVSPVSYIAAFRDGRKATGKSPEALAAEIMVATTRYIRDIVGDTHPDACVLVFDSPFPTHRSRFLAGYKAHRAKKKADADEDKKALEAARQAAVGMLFAAPPPGCNEMMRERYESDDLIAAFVHALRVGPDGSRLTARQRIMIATNDSDLCQLLDFANVDMLDVSKRQYVTRKQLEERVGYPCRWIPLVKAIGGDVSDNIPGVADIGEKTALKFLAGQPLTERERGLIEGGWELVEEFYDLTRLPFSGCSLKGQTFDAGKCPDDMFSGDGSPLPF